VRQYDLDLDQGGRGSSKPPKRPAASSRKTWEENRTGGDGIRCAPSTLNKARMIYGSSATIIIVEGQKEEAGALCEADNARLAKTGKEHGNQRGTPRSESASLGHRRWSRLLTDTHLPGDNRREAWFVLTAERSRKKEWDSEKIELEVRKCAEKAVFARHIKDLRVPSSRLFLGSP
jgi:hypothetical protein